MELEEAVIGGKELVIDRGVEGLVSGVVELQVMVKSGAD